jgi:hydroxymethylbilane synthase
MQKLRIATRSSPLALWQAEAVAKKLNKAGFVCELSSIETLGDKKLDVTLSKIGDKGVFTQELEQMLIDGEARLAVHSAKDMPSNLPENLEIIAFTSREKAHDIVLSQNADFRLENRKMIVGTASTRRVATLKRYFPEIETIAVRGNLQTRIRKMTEGQCDALLLAYAGVFRMGFAEMICQNLDLNVFTPAVGQGSLAIEVNQNLETDLKLRIKAALNSIETEIAIECERAFLRKMEGGCSVPVFGYATFENNILNIVGGIISLNGKEEIRKSVSIQLDPLDVVSARKLGEELANLVLNAGGDVILSKIKQNLQS